MCASPAAWSHPGGLFLLVSLLAGCATPLQSDRLREHAGALAPIAELVDVPFFPQEAYQCGPAALATVLNWAEVTVTPEALAPQIYLPGRRGSLQLELLGGARRHGSVPYVLAPDLAVVLTEVAAGHPVVVLQNLAFRWYPKWHYAVVVGFDIPRGEIVLRSGREQRHVLPLHTFERTWLRAGQWAMVAMPPARLPATADELSYLGAVVALERLGRTRDADVAYRAALARWPTSLGALLGIGNVQHAHGDIAGAEDAFRRATLAHPDAGAAFNNLAQTLADQGRWIEAKQAALRAVELGGPLLLQYRETLHQIERGARAADAD